MASARKYVALRCVSKWLDELFRLHWNGVRALRRCLHFFYGYALLCGSARWPCTDVDALHFFYGYAFSVGMARPHGPACYWNGLALTACMLLEMAQPLLWPCISCMWLGLVWPAFYLEGAALDMACVYQRWRGLYGPAVPCYD